MVMLGGAIGCGIARGAPGVGVSEVAGAVATTGAVDADAGAEGACIGAEGVKLGGAGSGWRGPDRIWPGLGGGGDGRAGMGIPRGATGGTRGDPLNKGGRNGCAARGAGAGSSLASFPTTSFFSDSDFGAVTSATGRTAGAAVSVKVTVGRWEESSAASRGFAAPEAKCRRTIRA